MRKPSFYWSALVVWMIGGYASLVAQGSAPAFSRSPYLQFATPNSIHVVWRTKGPVSPVVRFGERLEQLSEVSTNIVVRASLGTKDQAMPAKWEALRTEENLKLPKLHSAPLGTFQYEAKMAGLNPATRYFYAVFDGDRRMTPSDASYSFITPPPVGTKQPVRFWVVGDGGTGRQGQGDVYTAMLNYVRRDNHPLSFWIHVGDMAYGTGRDMEFQSRFFESYEPTLRSAVCWPAMGNHEGFTSKGTTGIGPYFDAYVVPKRGEAGGVASGTEAYYAFDHANIHFICLDSHDLERKPSGAMARWLKADLEKANSDWLIAFWHHPPYTKGSHDSDKEKDLTEMRQYIMPLIDSGGVDLVLTGHSHIYERSMLIDGAYATPTVAENVILDDGDGDPQGDGPYRKSNGINSHEGTLQIVTGNGGQTLGRNGTMPLMKKTIVDFGSVIVDVNGDTLRATMVDRTGKTRDLVSLVKRGKVQPVRLALPWQPEEYKKGSNDVKSVIGLPVENKVLIAKHAEWRYLAGQHPQGLNWATRAFDASMWKTGASPLGVGNSDVQTVLPDMRDKPPVLYLRREFEIEQADSITELGLMVNYADAFIAYINGQEVARVGVGRSHGRNAQKIKPREDHGVVYVPFKDSKNLRDGINVIGLEVHGVDAVNSDLLIDPCLMLED